MSKILIIEDDPVMSRMYERAFLFEKFETILASDGFLGYQKAVEIIPDLIMLDIMMPKMNGFEVLEALKKNQKTAHIPVVMLSNLASDQDIKIAMSKGASKYLVKSQYEPKQVVDEIKKLSLSA